MSWENSESIWLPYTQMQDYPTPLPVTRTKGSYIFLAGKKEKLLDGISSWWSSCHGYNHPYLLKQAKKQLKTMPHIMLAGLANKPAYNLSDNLIKFVNKTENNAKLEKVFFSDSGSTAVEVSLKIAVQYFLNKEGYNSKKNKIISFSNSYHGDTMGGMSLSDTKTGMHAKFKNYLPKQLNIKLPENEPDFIKYEQFLVKNHHLAAALIIEPLVQCAGGMKFHNEKTLEKIIKISKKYDILVIFDECATGFYRLGQKFAFHSLKNVTPDMLIIGKALTGGVMTLAATIVQKKIFDNFLSNSLDNALMHGPTFMGNPLACSVANASLFLFCKSDYEQKVKKIEAIFKKELEIFRKTPEICNIRVKGALAALELRHSNWGIIQKLRKNLLKENVWLRPFSNVIYFMPSLLIKPSEIKRLCQAVYNTISKG